MKRTGPRSAPTLRRRLAALVLATVIPAIVILGAGAVLLWRTGRAATDADLLARAGALSAVVDRELGTAKSTLRALATSPSLENGNLQDFHRQILQTQHPEGSRIILSDADGQILVNSRVEMGTHMSRRGDLDILHRVFETGQAQISSLYRGSVTQDPLLSVDVPVFRNGQVAYDLNMSLDPQTFVRALAQQKPGSDEWVAALVDGQGHLIARVPEDRDYTGRTVMPEVIQAISGEMPGGVFFSHAMGGDPTRAAYSHVAMTSWSTVIAVRRSVVDALLWRSLGIVSLIGAAMLAVGMSAALHQANRIRRSIAVLRDRERSGHGSTGLLEVDDVSEHLAIADAGRRQAEEALRESETRFRVITDAMPQMVWSARADGYHDYYNQKWFEFTGVDPGQVAGQGWAQLFHEDDRETAYRLWQESLASGTPYEMEFRLRRTDGSYQWMLGRALPVRDPETGRVTRWFGTSTDIEDAVAARQSLARSREDLERVVSERTQDLAATQAKLAQAQRMDALGQLAGGIAHDFNNVLQAVQGGASLITRRAGDPDKVARLAGMIHEAADRGAAITRRLLSFSRRGDLRAEPVDVAFLLSGMKELLSHTLGAGIEVCLEISEDVGLLLADKGQLETVLINLATNARDAMSGTGVITMSACLDMLDGQAGLQGTYMRLAVADKGMGMDAKTLARASEPFFTTKAPGQGTGLGLAMARGFAEQSGGAFAIRSQPGSGTVVEIWLPLAKAGQTHPQPCQAVRNPGPAPMQARIMLVDDEDIVRNTLTPQLEDWGYSVLSAKSGQDALALLDAGESIDLIVSDLSMPRMDGMTLLREVHKRRRGLPAILLTGFATNAAEIAIGGEIGGAFSLLRKPVEGSMLAERIAVLLEATHANI